MIFDEELHVEMPKLSPVRETFSQFWVYVQDRWYKLTHCFCRKKQ